MDDLRQGRILDDLVIALGYDPATGVAGSVVIGSGHEFVGSPAVVEPKIAALADGTEYIWLKTNGVGVLVDIIAGVA